MSSREVEGSLVDAENIVFLKSSLSSDLEFKSSAVTSLIAFFLLAAPGEASFGSLR